LHHCRYVTEEVQANSLVLIDELGKGTEAIWGTAVTSAMLKHMAAAGAR
jgi:DNA mismatch repair ATPase MutS